MAGEKERWGVGGNGGGMQILLLRKVIEEIEENTMYKQDFNYSKTIINIISFLYSSLKKYLQVVSSLAEFELNPENLMRPN